MQHRSCVTVLFLGVDTKQLPFGDIILRNIPIGLNYRQVRKLPSRRNYGGFKQVYRLKIPKSRKSKRENAQIVEYLLSFKKY